VKKFISPERVIDVLTAAKVRFALAGAHMTGGWMNQSRTTDDVHVVVALRQIKAAVQALNAAFPKLVISDNPVVTRFTDPRTETVVIDVMKPNQPLFEVLWQHTQWIETRKRKYRIPTLEFALTMKFAAMVSPNRRPIKKRQDGVDFGNMVLANPVIDLKKLASLGARVYSGGSAEIVAMVRQVRTEEGLEL
jgi:hypothetical protein